LNPSNIYVSTEDGSLLGYDIRNPEKPLFAVKAHAKAATTVSSSIGVNGMVVTASLDGLVKLWDVQTINNDGEPTLVIEKNFKGVRKFFEEIENSNFLNRAKSTVVLSIKILLGFLPLVPIEVNLFFGM